jgi:hypothetical protein
LTQRGGTFGRSNHRRVSDEEAVEHLAQPHAPVDVADFCQRAEKMLSPAMDERLVYHPRFVLIDCQVSFQFALPGFCDVAFDLAEP